MARTKSEETASLDEMLSALEPERCGYHCCLSQGQPPTARTYARLVCLHAVSVFPSAQPSIGGGFLLTALGPLGNRYHCGGPLDPQGFSL